MRSGHLKRRLKSVHPCLKKEKRRRRRPAFIVEIQLIHVLVSWYLNEEQIFAEASPGE